MPTVTHGSNAVLTRRVDELEAALAVERAAVDMLAAKAAMYSQDCPPEGPCKYQLCAEAKWFGCWARWARQVAIEEVG